MINSAATLGQPITINGQTYDFTGQGNADTARIVSDQMAQTLLDLQRTNDPTIIRQRLAELQAADPQGYAARQQLFDRIMADANNHPGRPIANDLQQQIQDELARGGGFSDAKQEEQVRESVRGGQVARGITLGESPTAQEASFVTQTGEGLQSQRQQNALNLLESGSSPEDVAYRELQQNLANLANFQSGQTPTAQFGQVSAARSGPVQLTGQAPSTNTFNPNAGAQGQNNALGVYGGQTTAFNGQSNPWLSGLSVGANVASTAAQVPWSSFFSSPNTGGAGTYTPAGGYSGSGEWGGFTGAGTGSY